MGLPKTKKPIFDLFVPSQNKNVKSRPFLVKEEKVLLMAYESGESKDIVLALKQIINNCVLEPKFDVDSLAMFDLEFMFLKIRAKSVSNIVSLTYRDTEDEQEYNFNINLDDVEMLYPPVVDKKIMLDDVVGITMKWPSITIIDSLPKGLSATETVDYLIIKCIDQIFDEDNVYPSKESTDAELEEFIGELEIPTFDKLKSFFNSLPEMHHEIKYKNSKGSDRKIELKTLSDFFTWG